MHNFDPNARAAQYRAVKFTFKNAFFDVVLVTIMCPEKRPVSFIHTQAKHNEPLNNAAKYNMKFE